MKIIRTICTLVIALFVFNASIAQTETQRPLTKKEKKEWRKKKKKMSDEDFRMMYEQNTAQKASIASMQSEISNLESQVSENDALVSDLQKQVTRMQAAYQAAQRELENRKSQSENLQSAYNPNIVNGEDFSIGVVFRVQVGAFRKMDLEKYANSSNEFDQEEMEELRRYVIGHFRNYEDANVLKRYLREMGVEDAWIVPYKDNRRVPLKEVIGDGASGSN
jgi:septal ring factor EnvC (AmiA/AmiB activator)